MFKLLTVFMLVVSTLIVPPIALVTVPILIIWLSRTTRRAQGLARARDAYVDQQELAMRRKAAGRF